MSHAGLDQLSSGGFAAFRADQLGELADFCRAECFRTGDARYFVLAEMFEQLDTWWAEHDEAGGIPIPLRDDIGALLSVALREILEAEPPLAARLSVELRSELRHLQTRF